ncbi:MAG: DUF5667 domain-containing protein [Anaerolineae bacterium]
MNTKGFESKVSAQRDLTQAEREQVMQVPNLRDQLQRAEAQDALLASLPQPRVTTQVIGRILTATTLSPARNLALRTQARRWAAAVALALTVALSSTGYATASSLPGDTLYPLKRDAEQVRMALTFNTAERSAYQLHLGAVRRAEAQQVLARGRQGVEVDFVGTLQQDADGGWSVSGVPVTLESGVVMTPGMQVQVHGAIEGQRVRARLFKAEDGTGEGGSGYKTPGAEEKQDGSQHRYGQQTADASATNLPSETVIPAETIQNTPLASYSDPETTTAAQVGPSQEGAATTNLGALQYGKTTTPQPGPKGGKH